MTRVPRELLDLKVDWDSYGAKPPTEEAVKTAENLTFTPLSDGGIQVEMHAGEADVEIEIDPHGRVESVMWARGGEAR